MVTRIIVQRDATQNSSFIILKVHSTCFGCQPHPPSGLHKTETTASGTGHILCSYLPPKWPRWREVAAQNVWPVPEAAVTVLCSPDGGFGWHPKHVEWTFRIIKGLFCFASCWTIINAGMQHLFAVQNLYFFYPTSVCIMWRIFVYVHTYPTA